MSLHLLLPVFLGCGAPVEGDAARLVRLTATQWDLAAAHALRSPAPSGISAGFVADPASGTFDNNADELVVTSTLWQQTQAASIALADDAIEDADQAQRLFGGPVGVLHNPATRDAWLAQTGRRAWRRSLTVDELHRYRELFEHGAAALPSYDAADAGARLALVGLLQSPHFAYRVERAAAGSDTLAPLSFASKLSFALWNGPPDEPLLSRAEAAADAEDLLDALPRMLEDDRAAEMVRDLHRQMLHVDTYTNIPREFVSYEDYDSTLNAAMQAEVDAFVYEIVFSGGTVSDLLTSRLTFADGRIADLYGVAGVRGEGLDAMQAVDLDPTERAGLLTLSGFLAVHSSEQAENLIRRSAFVHDAMLCTPVPPPPPDATALPPSEEPQSTRERIVEHTETCGGACHTELLNPLAFSFGQYDEMGRYRGDPDIDASSSFGFSFGETGFDGAVELSELLAEDADVHRCYATKLLSYLEGRRLTDADEARLVDLAEASMAGEPILGLLTDIVSHPQFRSLRPVVAD